LLEWQPALREQRRVQPGWWVLDAARLGSLAGFSSHKRLAINLDLRVPIRAYSPFRIDRNRRRNTFYVQKGAHFKVHIHPNRNIQRVFRSQCFALSLVPTAKNDHIPTLIEGCQVVKYPRTSCTTCRDKEKHCLSTAKLAAVDLQSPLVDHLKLWQLPSNHRGPLVWGDNSDRSWLPKSMNGLYQTKQD
jgi:hypothetical protein